MTRPSTTAPTAARAAIEVRITADYAWLQLKLKEKSPASMSKPKRSTRFIGGSGSFAKLVLPGAWKLSLQGKHANHNDMLDIPW